VSNGSTSTLMHGATLSTALTSSMFRTSCEPAKNDLK
jgi:hypothetical protein